MALRAIVIGTGWAGEGHTLALQAAGVEVMALCGRTPEPARAMAEKLGVKEVRFDWRTALEEFGPDIVTIATPAGPHHEIAVAAAEAGRHVVCEKPLAVDAAKAREMLVAVERAGVKHAYGATSCYAASFRHARQLLGDGLVGQVREIDYLLHVAMPPLIPYSWAHRLQDGGGALNNIFTHQLQQVLLMTAGQVRAATGEARILDSRVPVGRAIHDFRDIFGAVLTPDEAAAAEWREADADQAYTVVVQLQLADESMVNVLFRNSGVGMPPQPSALTFFGTEGILRLSGPFWSDGTIEHFAPTRGAWTELALPQAVVDTLPPIEDDSQRHWNLLYREFVADVQGEGYAGYPTFRDGWVAVEVMDIARNGRSWTPLPE